MGHPHRQENVDCNPDPDPYPDLDPDRYPDPKLSFVRRLVETKVRLKNDRLVETKHLNKAAQLYNKALLCVRS